MASDEIPFETLAARYSSEDESSRSDKEIEAKRAAKDESEDEDSDLDALDEKDIPSLSNSHFQGVNERDDGKGPKYSQPLKNAFQKLDAHIHTGILSYTASEEIEDVNTDSRVDSHLRETEKKRDKTRIRVTDKKDRATVDGVLDRRTRSVLLKLLNRGIFSEIYGVISTGKEANVYHAIDPSGSDLAIKIYKTSILGFRDRDRYVSGDYRFRKGYSHSNPRKMVTTWAEKEMRNLIRLKNAGIRAPCPIEQKLHVLVMDFVGEDHRAAPRLKDTSLTHEACIQIHRELCLLLWKLYSQCKLVHADFSEYNILVVSGNCVVIDVSQSVDLDHPLVLDFLRNDCTRLIEFFQRKNLGTLTLRELFDFVTDPTVTLENAELTLDKLLEEAQTRFSENVIKEDESEVFKNVFLPRKLEEVVDYERDIENLQKGESQGIYYQTMMGLTEDLSGVKLVPKIIEDEVSESESETTVTSEIEDDESPRHPKPSSSKDEIKSARKDNKKAVKETNREKRKTKLPKHVKKQLVKKGKRRS